MEVNIDTSENKENIAVITSSDKKDRIIDSGSKEVRSSPEEIRSDDVEKIQSGVSDIDSLSLSLENSKKSSPEIIELKKEEGEGNPSQEQLRENISHFSDSNIPSKSPKLSEGKVQREPPTNEKQLKVNSPGKFGSGNQGSAVKPNSNSPPGNTLTKKTSAEIFYEACKDRKKEAYNNLRGWDEQRAQFLNFHRNLIEQIQGGVDFQVNCSQELMNVLIRYFHDRVAQEVGYTRFPLPRIKKMAVDFKERSLADNRILGYIEELESSQGERARACIGFAQTIEKEILGNILLREMKDYEEKVGFLREAMILNKKKLTILNANTSRSSSKFSNLFISMANTPYGGKRPLKDLYKKEMKFILLAREQAEIQRELARQTLCFWETVLDLERIRRKALEQAFKIYNDAYLECYKNNPHLDKGLEILQEAEGVTSANLGFNKLLRKEDFEAIKSSLPAFNIDSITFSELEKFFVYFQFSKLDEKALVLKDMKAHREITTWSGPHVAPNPNQRPLLENGEVFKECKVLFTVDGFLAVSELPVKEGELKKPFFAVSLEKMAYRVRPDRKVLELQRSIPGFLMNSTERFTFKFDSKDELEEFVEFANRLRF